MTRRNKSYPIIILCFLVLLFITCNQKEENDFEKNTKGKEIYEKKCVACHSIMNTTTYNPTLIEMHSRDSVNMSKLIQAIKIDSNHIPFFEKLTEEDINELIFFIKNYKTVVPDQK